jgi:RNA processing factor Prp31
MKVFKVSLQDILNDPNLNLSAEYWIKKELLSLYQKESFSSEDCETLSNAIEKRIITTEEIIQGFTEYLHKMMENEDLDNILGISEQMENLKTYKENFDNLK